jgi:hypothetical protein
MFRAAPNARRLSRFCAAARIHLVTSAYSPPAEKVNTRTKKLQERQLL